MSSAVVTSACTSPAASRFLVLFVAGAGFSLVQRMLLAQRSSNRSGVFMRELQASKPFVVPDSGDGDLEAVASIISERYAWSIAVVVGSASALVGLLCPHIERVWGLAQSRREWADVLRGIALFAGANHASARIEFPNAYQLTLTLIVLGGGIWWLCDRSRCGFVIGCICALVAAASFYGIDAAGLAWWNERDCTFLRAWLPFAFFTGGVTAGNIGRQLSASYDKLKDHCE